jgi:hypothetical protein
MMKPRHRELKKSVQCPTAGEYMAELGFECKPEP